MDQRYLYSFYYGFPPFNMTLLPYYPFSYCQNPELPFYGQKSNIILNKTQEVQEENHFQTIKKEESNKLIESQECQQKSKEVASRKISNCQKQNSSPKESQSKYQTEFVECRNILPNITSNILSFVRRVNRSGKVVERIIKKFSSLREHQIFAVKKFYAYQYYLKENMTDFKGKNAIDVLTTCLNSQCPCFTLQEQAFYNKVCRTLISYYLTHQLFSDILSSNRVTRTNRKDYLGVKRYLESKLKRGSLRI